MSASHHKQGITQQVYRSMHEWANDNTMLCSVLRANTLQRLKASRQAAHDSMRGIGAMSIDERRTVVREALNTEMQLIAADG